MGTQFLYKVNVQLFVTCNFVKPSNNLCEIVRVHSESYLFSSTRQTMRVRVKSPEPPDTASVVSSKSR